MIKIKAGDVLRYYEKFEVVVLSVEDGMVNTRYEDQEKSAPISDVESEIENGRCVLESATLYESETDDFIGTFQEFVERANSNVFAQGGLEGFRFGDGFRIEGDAIYAADGNVVAREVRETRMKRRMVVIDNASGYIWHVTDADSPTNACILADCEARVYGRWYDIVDSLMANETGYRVHEAPAGWDCDDGQDEAKIAEAEAMPLIAIVKTREADA